MYMIWNLLSTWNLPCKNMELDMPKYLVGGIPTRLKNDGVRQLG